MQQCLVILLPSFRNIIRLVIDNRLGALSYYRLSQIHFWKQIIGILQRSLLLITVLKIFIKVASLDLTIFKLRPELFNNVLSCRIFDAKVLGGLLYRNVIVHYHVKQLLLGLLLYWTVIAFGRFWQAFRYLLLLGTSKRERNIHQVFDNRFFRFIDIIIEVFLNNFLFGILLLHIDLRFLINFINILLFLVSPLQAHLRKPNWIPSLLITTHGLRDTKWMAKATNSILCLRRYSWFLKIIPVNGFGILSKSVNLITKLLFLVWKGVTRIWCVTTIQGQLSLLLEAATLLLVVLTVTILFPHRAICISLSLMALGTVLLIEGVMVTCSRWIAVLSFRINVWHFFVNHFLNLINFTSI